MKQESLFYGGDLLVAESARTSTGKRKKGCGFYWVTTRLLREYGPWYADAISSPEDVVNILREHMDIENLDRENFLVLCLNRKNRVNAIHTVSIGGLASSLVHPREVFKPAFLTSSAALILVHNHPSGDPTPSTEDITITRRLVEAGKLLGIEILDHVVIGYGRYNSMKSKSLM